VIISFEVVGLPKAQPRAKATIRGRHAGVYNPGTANDWKEAVKSAALRAVGLDQCFRDVGLQPLKLTIVLSLPAPKIWRTLSGKPTKKCPKPTILDWRDEGGDVAPNDGYNGHGHLSRFARTVYPDCQKPDWDNLGKSTCDALNDCGFWHDDAQCHDVHIVRWRSFDPPGAIITVETL
jgi:Holliday junction resolvase RusA-like endonuclease